MSRGNDDSKSKSVDDAGNLLYMLGEEVKQPLIAISQLSELKDKGELINVQAKKALRTIDNILLFNRINSGQTALSLEPVHVGSTIADVAYDMEPLMRQAGCQTEIRIQKSLSPIDVDRQVFRGAVQGLWQALLSTMPSNSNVRCTAQKTSDGVRLSLTSRDAVVENLSLKNANYNSLQPITAIAGPASDLLAARGMFSVLGGELTKTEGTRLSGFGVTLKTSQQLQML